MPAPANTRNGSGAGSRRTRALRCSGPSTRCAFASRRRGGTRARPAEGFDGEPVMLIGQQKGRSTKENIARSFGMPRPEGYRKALRLMKLAERFGRPVIAFIDTPGAYPGIDAEERGQAEAIAVCLEEMAGLLVPVISVVIGEGGSGGALAIGVCNRLLMLQYSWYSVISPESCAAILYRDSSKGEKAAEALKLTARDAYEL